MGDEEREYKKITKEELIQVVEDHEKWLKWRETPEKERPEGMEKGERAVLNGFDLREFDDLLRAFNLKKAGLEWANLEGAQLCEANLERASLRGAYLVRANLDHASLERADLNMATLVRTSFFQAYLKGAELGEARMDDADLRMANLEGAWLECARLERALLGMAYLKGAFLYAVNLKEASLETADLEGANLEMANLEGTNVAGVKYNRRTKLRGCRVSNCFGSPRFRSFAMHQDFIEELRWGRWWERLLVAFWNVIADCGRTPWLWIGWSVLFAVYFGLNFYWMEPGSFKVADLPTDNPWTYIYYSVVTFTTLGFGDVTPTTLAAARWVMAEVIMGYVMLGGLISIFATLITPRR